MLLAMKGKTLGSITSQLAGRGITGPVPLKQAQAITDALHMWASNTIPFSLMSMGAVVGTTAPTGIVPGLGVFTLPYFPGASGMAGACGMPGQIPALFLDAVSAGLSSSWSNTFWVGQVAGAVGVGAGIQAFANPVTLGAWLSAAWLAHFAPGTMTGAKYAMIQGLTLSISLQFQAGLYVPIAGLGPPSPFPGGGMASNPPGAGPIMSVPFAKWIPA